MKLQSNPGEAHLVPGYKLDDRYELLYPYAQGGMATVWMGRIQGKHGFEKLVAIKTILPHLASDDGFRTMFLDEASIASRIRHPNVAAVDDLGEESNTLYMVLEWVNGDSWAKLHAAITKAGHPFPLNILLRIAAEACAGLHAAHELRDENGVLINVVHRDVSPQNILITNGGVTKVIDFGIAKALDRTAEQTRTGLLKGKAQYTAPEQCRASMTVDRRADIWAIGTILYHYLTGQLPYEGKNDLMTLRNLTSGRPPPPLPPSVPAGIASVVMTALAHNPDHRFATALDMQRALEGVMPAPTTSNDVAALMGTYLSDRMEMRRKDLAEAIAEAEERSGKPRRTRSRLGSFPELAPPPVLDQALGRAPFASDPGIAPAPAVMPTIGPPPGASPARPAIEEPATQVREQGWAALRPRHWALVAVGAAMPLAVWGLVGYVYLSGQYKHGPAAPAPSASAPAAASAVPR